MPRHALIAALVLLLIVLGAAGGVAAFVALSDEGGLAQRELPGDAGFRHFAAEIQAALDAEDAEFFAGRMRTTPVVCTAEVMQGGLGGPTCDFEGQRYDGFPIGRWRSEGNVVPALGALLGIARLYESALRDASDDFGDGRPRVYAIAAGGDDASAVLTTLIDRPADFAGSGPLRVAVVTFWTFESGRWEITSYWNASALAEEFLLPCPDALDVLSGPWERFPDPNAAGPGSERCPFGA